MTQWPLTVALLKQHAARAHGTEVRPAEPTAAYPANLVWYRGWEAGYEGDRACWTGEGYTAYKGGCDLDAPQVTAATWAELLDAIDDEEDE